MRKAYERREERGMQTNYKYLDQNNTSYAIGPPPRPFMQRELPEEYQQQQTRLPLQGRRAVPRMGTPYGNNYCSCNDSPYRPPFQRNYGRFNNQGPIIRRL